MQVVLNLLILGFIPFEYLDHFKILCNLKFIGLLGVFCALLSGARVLRVVGKNEKYSCQEKYSLWSLGDSLPKSIVLSCPPQMFMIFWSLPLFNYM